MADQINGIAVSAAKDIRMREELIRSNEQLILRTASRACRKYVSKSDDEWSVALCAFNRAVDLYSPERGNFLPFAQMLIKRDLIDLHRKNAGIAEVPTAPYLMEGNGEPEEDTNGVYRSVVRSSISASNTDLHDEILLANELLAGYGFRFMDLTDCSPRQEKTRMECAAAIRYMLEQPLLKKDLYRSKKLPVRTLASGSGISRKVIDRYRRYLIMAVIVIDGDFPYLREYLKYIVKEG